MVSALFERNRDLYVPFGTVPSAMLSLVGRDGEMDLYDGVLRARHADGTIRFDGVPQDCYGEKLRETVRSWSYMKFPYFAELGPDDGWYKVGPLARLQNCDSIPTPLAEAERQAFVASLGPAVVHAPLAFHWARLIELLHAAEVIQRLLADPELLGDALTATGPRHGTGIGILEAPRGTLIHHYEIGDDDLVKRCNLVVATTHNNQAMNEAIREVARVHLDGHEPTNALLNHIEVAIRAFDPCLSCATHALGQMPLLVEVINADGVVVGRTRRDATVST